MKEVLAALALIKEIVDGGKALVAFVQENRNEKWFQDSIGTFTAWRKSATPAEKKKAVEDLRDLIRGL